VSHEAVATLTGHRDQLDRLTRALLAKETLNEDEAYAAAGVPQDTAPGARARGDVPGVPPEPGMPPLPPPAGSTADSITRPGTRPGTLPGAKR
jgi:hypothetical protein